MVDFSARLMRSSDLDLCVQYVIPDTTYTPGYIRNLGYMNEIEQPFISLTP